MTTSDSSSIQQTAGVDQITYAQAINQAMHQAMELSDDVLVLGQLVDYKPGVFGTTTGLAERFGTDRVKDFTIAESVMTTTAIGAALVGKRPVLVHQRLDFMMYSLDAITNWLALWRFKSNGASDLPVTIRAVVGKGWGQGPQHSKSTHAWFAHLPGIRVAIPATAYDAKGLLLESILGNTPSIIIESRSLFSMADDVPQVPYRVRYGRAAVRREGSDVSLVCLGAFVPAALRVASTLVSESIDVEVVDLRTVSPLDVDGVCASVSKTKRLVVADPAWRSSGVAAEVIASVAERMGPALKSPPVRVTHPDSHTPMSAPLEQAYYPDDGALADAVRVAVRGK